MPPLHAFTNTGDERSASDMRRARAQGSFDRRDAHPPRISAPYARHYEEATLPENLLCGRNPVREALRAGRTLDKVLVARGEMKGPLGEIIQKAREAGVVVQQVERSRLDEVCQGTLHQGIAAYTAAQAYVEVEDILAYAKEKGEDPFIIVLDGIEDPHNLGSILRSAECVGAHGVIIPKRRAAGLTPTVAKSSSGAVEYVKVARVTNIVRTLEQLKGQGLWIAGAAMSGDDYRKADLKGPLALVVGAEGEGLSHLVCRQCDFMLSIPLCGRIDSLNASVAAGILMYEVLRRRQA
nr:23S rRNA (guanosine(2251)-2'-O)-methyltransferase RlmB [Maliibacterium massiliense]